ncbi:MAG: hypothetical protein R2881_07600 [Eubacteriales bacterium]
MEAVPIRLLSVTRTNLTNLCAEQMSSSGRLNREKDKKQKLDQAMDQIRTRFGKDAISYARLIEKEYRPVTNVKQSSRDETLYYFLSIAKK